MAAPTLLTVVAIPVPTWPSFSPKVGLWGCGGSGCEPLQPCFWSLGDSREGSTTRPLRSLIAWFCWAWFVDSLSGVITEVWSTAWPGTSVNNKPIYRKLNGIIITHSLIKERKWFRFGRRRHCNINEDHPFFQVGYPFKSQNQVPLIGLLIPPWVIQVGRHIISW